MADAPEDRLRDPEHYPGLIPRYLHTRRLHLWERQAAGSHHTSWLLYEEPDGWWLRRITYRSSIDPRRFDSTSGAEVAIQHDSARRLLAGIEPILRGSSSWVYNAEVLKERTRYGVELYNTREETSFTQDDSTQDQIVEWFFAALSTLERALPPLPTLLVSAYPLR